MKDGEKETLNGAPPGMKKCSTCQRTKPQDQFHKNCKYKDGLNFDCKACSNTKVRAWRLANPDKARACTRAWKLANPDKVRARVRASYLANPDKARARGRAWKLANPDNVRASARASNRRTQKSKNLLKLIYALHNH